MVKGVYNYFENQHTTTLCGSITHDKKIMEIKDVYMRIKQKLGVDRDDQIAEKLGITKQSVSGFKKRGTLPYEALIVYCEKHQISVEYILFGYKTDEKVNDNLRIENAKLQAKLDLVRELLDEAYGKGRT